MLGSAFMSRQCLAGAPGAIAGLNSGLQAWGHPGMIARPGDVAGVLDYRFTEEDGPNGWEKWLEIGFTSPVMLAGDASRGWVDTSGRVRLWLEWSETLTEWTTGMFIDCASTATPVAGGYEYWSRCTMPQDSAESTGQLWAESTAISGDTRNNPFTALTINSTVQALANFPYTMPGDAAQLQTDLRAIGWTGATVVASSDVAWRIDIPNVNFVDYHTFNAIHWPLYLVPDMYGNVVNPVSYWGFTGDFVNTANVRTKLPKQFARLGLLSL